MGALSLSRRILISFGLFPPPGHGGLDPGKVGVDGQLEKEINLQIIRKLKAYLEMNDVEVVMTRESDAGLNDADASNKKVQDMKRRIALIEERPRR